MSNRNYEATPKPSVTVNSEASRPASLIKRPVMITIPKGSAADPQFLPVLLVGFSPDALIGAP